MVKDANGREQLNVQNQWLCPTCGSADEATKKQHSVLKQEEAQCSQ
jgi:ubiquitin C-terminal hydrolase